MTREQNGCTRWNASCFLGAAFPNTEEDPMQTLLWLAGLLIVLWIAAQVLGFVLGAALHLLWIGALVLFAIWLVRRFTGRRV